MMQCTQCQAPSLPGKRFCGDCGTPLAQVCPACGVQDTPGKKFCGDCGAAFSAEPRPVPPAPVTRPAATAAPVQPAPVLLPALAVAKPTAERRHMTIMFCDLVGSTPLAERLDLEDMRDVIAAYHRTVASVITEGGGFLARHIGDGVLAYFGYPHSREEGPEWAVRASLAVTGAVMRLVSPAGPAGTLLARVGIASGLVVVGDMAEAGTGESHAVVGETPNLAARLQSLAAPGSVVIDSATRRLVGGLFVCSTLGAQVLKGMADPVQAWLVQAESRGLSRFEALRTESYGALVGRQEELDFLRRRWRRARDGDGCAVLISGEGGIGKSRLVDALEAGLADEAAVRLHCYCAPHHQGSPYHPLIAFLEQAAGFEIGDEPAVRLAKLSGLLGRVGLSGDAVAALSDLLTIPGDRPKLPAHRRKERIVDALVGYVEAVARHSPALLLVEDAHWLDPSSRELLDMIVERLLGLPLLMVVTFRPEFEAPWLGHPEVSLLSLSRLDRRQAAAIVAQVAASSGLSEELCERIVTGADGVPLYVEELTKAVLDGQRTLPGRGSDRLVVPSSLQASLMARLDRQPAAKEVAQIGSVIGRSFAEALLTSVAQMPEALVQLGFKELIASRIASRRGESPNATYTFKHALVQDAAYDSMLRDRRISLHDRVAARLRQGKSGDMEAPPELLGHHYAEARQTEEAARHFLWAGQRSAERSAMVEARAHLTRGAALAAELPPGPVRALLEAELGLLLGNVQMSVYGFGSAEHGTAFAQAAVLCRTLERLEPLQVRFPMRALYGDWTCKLHRGDLVAAMPVAAEMRGLGSAQPDPETRITSETTYGFTRLLGGHLAEAWQVYQAALPLADEPASGTSMAEYGFDAAALLHGQSSRALACLGFIDQAEQQAELALAAARRVNHQPTLAITLTVCATTAWILRDTQATASRSAELLALTAEYGFAFWLARGKGYAGWAACEAGMPDRGATIVREGMETLSGSGIALYGPGMAAMLADACRGAGQTEAAMEAVEAGLDLAYRTGEVWFAAELHRRRAELLQLLTPRDEVAGEAELLRAITLAQSQGAKLFELRAAASLAELWREQGRQAEAFHLLGSVHDWFTEGLGSRDLNHADSLLKQVAPTSRYMDRGAGLRHG